MIRYLRYLTQSTDGWSVFRDTVSSVGLVYGDDLPFSAGSANVEFFRHALSLDEVFNFQRESLRFSNLRFPAPCAIPAPPIPPRKGHQ